MPLVRQVALLAGLVKGIRVHASTRQRLDAVLTQGIAGVFEVVVQDKDVRATHAGGYGAFLGGIELEEHLVSDSKNGISVVGNGDKLSDVAILGVGSRHVFGRLVVGYDVVVIRVGPHTRCELPGLDLAVVSKFGTGQGQFHRHGGGVGQGLVGVERDVLVRGRRGRHKTDAVVVGGEDELGEIHCVEGKGGKYRAKSSREGAIAVAGCNCG